MKKTIRVLIIASIVLWCYMLFIIFNGFGDLDSQTDTISHEVTQDTNYVIIQKP